MSKDTGMYMALLDFGQVKPARKKKTTRTHGSSGNAKKGPEVSGTSCCHSGSACTGIPEFASDHFGACRACGAQDRSLKRCSVCKVEQYCSRECQKKDWKRHKKTCQTTDEPREMTWSQAKTKAQTLFPGQTILDLLSMISTVPTEGVFIGRIADMHFYYFRHGIYVQDRKGQQTNLFFYLDFDKPEPFFKWSDLQPGRYICIECPSFHEFRDGQVGFRIDEACEIKILR